MSAPPVFAVVGHVNKGKSSVISTLAEDDSVEIGDRPRTTRECRRFPVVVGGETRFELVDTPGFEEAPRALAWMRDHCDSVTERPDTVRRFVEAHADTDEFVVECRLLAPVVAGAAVLYVVDASRPYRSGYEAEMEILRWTGRPCLGVLNRLGAASDAEDDVRRHEDEWRTALGQHFQTVREFDAHAATFRERVRLLETLRELREDGRDAIDEALRAIRDDRVRRRESSAAAITRALVRMLTHRLRVRLGPDESVDERKPTLERRFHDDLRRFERDARDTVEALFHHRHLAVDETELERPRFDEDLFAEDTWSGLGLSPRQILTLYTAAGAATGLAFDAAVGGLSGFVPTMLGAGAGFGTGAYHLSRRLMRGSVAGGLLKGFAGLDGGREIRVGPHKNPNFPWVVLDRALLHFAAVATRTHARRDALRPGVHASDTPAATDAPAADTSATHTPAADTRTTDTPRDGLVATLDPTERKRLESTFRTLRSATSPDDVPASAQADLTRTLRHLLDRLDLPK